MGDPWVYSPKLGTAKSQGGAVDSDPGPTGGHRMCGHPQGSDALTEKKQTLMFPNEFSSHSPHPHFQVMSPGYNP